MCANTNKYCDVLKGGGDEPGCKMFRGVLEKRNILNTSLS